LVIETSLQYDARSEKHQKQTIYVYAILLNTFSSFTRPKFHSFRS